MCGLRPERLTITPTSILKMLITVIIAITLTEVYWGQAYGRPHAPSPVFTAVPCNGSVTGRIVQRGN